jgi:separase
MAWSLYYLGVMELDAARCSGALQKLWDKKEWDQTSFPIAYNDRNIQSARHHLSRALLYSSHASEIFARNTLRCLALAEGPRIRNGVAASAGILILRSIGQTIRRKLTLSFDQNDEWLEIEPFKNMKDIFGVFDGQNKPDKEMDEKIQLFLSELAARTPKDWGFVAPVICPSGELLVSIIQKTDPNSNEFTISTKCIFPPAGENAYDIIVKPLDTILARVEQQLKGVDPSLVSTSDDKETIKRKWWNERNCLDEEMRELLEDVESLYFSKVFDIPSDEDTSISSISSTNFEGLPRGNLTSRFEAAVNDGKEFRCDSEEDLEKKIDAMMKSTVPKLKDRLLSAGASKSQLRKLRKADLIELLIQIERDNQDDEIVEATVNECNSNESNNCDKCLFLVLDENLHRFPFEGMPVLKGKTVCRIPCLSFVLATLVERGDSPMIFPSVDPANVSYILNPENNLQATQDRLLPAIEGVASSRRCDWECVIGEIPPASFFFESFRRKDGLTMYFGHGGAQVCFSRRSVEELIEHRASSVPLNALESETETSPCRSTVLLMGCSSGKLVSVNRKHSDSIEETPLYYEPEGVALSYLCAGAPCVIGNLWDVTDNDIDR